MVPRRVLRPLMVALLPLVALAPLAGQPLPVAAATLALTVTSTTDSHDATPGDGVCADATSQCSLRAAVEEADAQPAGSAITITIPAGTYPLALGTVVLANTAITLAGAGARQTILDGQGHRALAVAVNAVATLDSLSVTDGNAGTGGGGGLANLGVTILSRSALVSDTAKNGGGLYNAPQAHLWLLSSLVVSSTAPSGSGGGIFNQGTVTVSRSVLSANTAQVGGAIASTGTLTLTTSSVTTNTATAGCSFACYGLGGGGIFNQGTARISSTTFSGNRANVWAGGIYNFGGTLRVTNSTFSGNTALDGGGIINSGTLTVATSTLSGNAASRGGGGGIWNQEGTARISSTTLSGNTASLDAGGIENDGSAAVTLTNSTLSGNTSTNFGGISNYGALAVTNSTLSGNAGAQGGGIYNDSGTVVLTGTIVANSTSGPNCSAPVTESAGYNLDSGTSCGFSQATDLSNTDPRLGPLANNGGPTPTMALLPGSPAIDHGGTSANGCPATDQRGVTRPQGPACDIGAYEAVPAAR